MIPILYDDGERQFVTNGIGRLSDCLSCTVTEERNGVYECEFVYPITGERYSDLQEGQLIYCTHDDTKVPQAFIIYGRTAPIDGVVTFYAHHISYKLRSTVITPFTASSITEAISKIPQHEIPESGFRFWTDKSTVGNFAVTEPRALRGVLGGEEGSLLDVYGKGDYEWDMFTVKLYQDRGTDSEIEIRYGKNLIDITNEIDGADTYNAIVPFWKGTDENGDVLVTLPEGFIAYSGATVRLAYLTDHLLEIIRTEANEPIEVPYTDLVAVPYDMSSSFEEPPTVEQLRAAATAYLESSNGWEPSQNITVDFVQMWQTEEYKDFAPLQRCRLCDTVSVYYPELGVEAVKKKVVKTVYNVLLDRYDQIELGDLQYSFSDIVTKGIFKEVPTTSMMDEAIQHATELITGGLGGYVVMKHNANGTPEEILIMDSPGISTAVNVIRMNRNGIGFSNSGYDGTYRTAWTIDGSFVADFITSGTLNANLIKAGVLSDQFGNTTLNLETGEFSITHGEINLGDGSFIVNDEGYMEAQHGWIGPWQLNSDGLYSSKDSAGVYAWLSEYGLSFETDSNTKAAFNRDGFGVYRNYNNDEYYFNVFADGSVYCRPNWGNAHLDLGDYGTNIAYKNAHLYVDADGAALSSSTADVLVNASGLTIVTGRSTTSHSGNLYITSTGLAYYANEGSSSRKIKTDIGAIKNDELDPSRLYRVDVIQYKYKDEFLSEDDENRGRDLIGFIVEDLNDAYPSAVQKEDPEESKTWTWSPYRIIPPMLKLIQDQKKEIDGLKEEVLEIKELLKEVIHADS